MQLFKRRFFGSGMTSIMISNEEMQDKPGKRVLRAGEGVIRNVE